MIHWSALDSGSSSPPHPYCQFHCPWGQSDGLPDGVMFVGVSFGDATTLASAHAFEQHLEVEL